MRRTRVVLAAAHLDHDPSNNRLRNLKSLCKRCHLIHDRPHHLAQRRITYLLRRALELIRVEFEEPTWQAFWRTTADGLSAIDVAAELGLSPGAVRQAKYRVLRRLRQELDE